jgi:hypothetical protein
MKKAGDFLTALLDAGFMEKASGYSQLFSSWSAIVTEVRMPSLADHSWIRELEKSVLLVEADHPGWIQLLQTKQSDLLKALRRRFPAEKLSGISFRLCREGPRKAADSFSAEPAVSTEPAQEAPVKPPLSEPALPAAENPARPEKKRRLETIKDTRLREALTRLEKALKR